MDATVTTIQLVGYILGIAGTLAVVVSVLLYAKTAGSIAAQEKIAETYKGLYESEREKAENYQRQNEELARSIKSMDERVKTLETERDTRKQTDDEWVTRVMTALSQMQVCDKDDCPNRQLPDRRAPLGRQS